MNQKTVIAVWNAANRGKTETLRHLAQLITTKHFDDITIMNYQKSEVNRDFKMVFKLRDKHIGIISEGDPQTGLRNKLDTFHHCDLIICTSRTKGTTVDEVEEFCKANQSTLIWSQTYKVDGALKSNQTIIDETNLLKAKHLLELIEKKQLI